MGSMMKKNNNTTRLAAYRLSAAEAMNDLQEDLSSSSGDDPRFTRYSKLSASVEATSYSQEQAILSPSSSSSSSSIEDQQHHHQPDWSSRAYQPKVFEEVVGHEMIIRALSNAVRRKRISPLYLFHGPGGTGKSSAARIFAMLLNCASRNSSSRPCWACTGCSNSLRTSQLWSRNKSFENIRNFLQSSPSKPSVFIFEASETAKHWEELLDIIADHEEQQTSGGVVFILVTEDASVLPKTVSSQCQKFSFSKLKDADVMLKLSRIVTREGIEISEDALELVARKADGNLREAENLLDQLALLEAKITAAIVQQLVGLVPHERLIHLLEATLSGRSAEAVRCTRDLIDCGMEPRSLVSQLSSLVIEILADVNLSSPPAIASAERLNEALKVLIETEKKLMTSPSNHTTWITGAVLQIASAGGPHRIPAGVMLSDNTDTTGIILADNKSDTERRPLARHAENLNADTKCIDMEELWHNILARIHNKRLREFLQCQTKIVSLTVSQANAIVHLIVKNSEEIPENMTDSLKVALGCPVTVNISREPAHEQIVRRDFSEPSSYRQHKLQPKAPENPNSTSSLLNQESVPNMESSIRPTNFQSGTQMLVGRTRHGHNRVLSDQLNHGRRDNNFVNPAPGSSRNVQCLDTNSTGRANEIMDRLLLIPSVPQTDTSIEPYSQDLLFEEAKSQRRQGQRYSKLYREFLPTKQHPHNMAYMHSGLNHSWSCRERLCRDENMVNEDTVDLATKRHVLKWVHPCKESNIVNSTINKGQSDLRKTVPASPAS